MECRSETVDNTPDLQAIIRYSEYFEPESCKDNWQLKCEFGDSNAQYTSSATIETDNSENMRHPYTMLMMNIHFKVFLPYYSSWSERGTQFNETIQQDEGYVNVHINPLIT